MRSSLSLYNQTTLNDDDFVANFVARHGEFETLIRRLRAADADGPGLHYILIGPRGMGKTTLLRRIAIAINREPDLSARYIPLSFREEQYNVLTLGDFWRNCGEALAEWAESTGRADLATRLDNALPTKAWADDDSSVEQFTAERTTLERRAVLLVDNIDLILEALPPNGNWTLRRHLQAPNGLTVIGAATQPLKQAADQGAAFYEFFQPAYLEPLDELETEGCVRALARARGDQGEHVIDVLDKQPERLKTLHTLTGGNPRVLALIYRLLEAGESDAAMADLEILLDQVTPYYKARVEEYQTAQQRAVIDAISLHWDPIMTGDLARVTGIAVTTLSPLLIRLRKDGLIESVETSGAYAAHQLVERFFNIWYLMRHGTRRAKQKMRWLVAFLTSFYSSRELADIAVRANETGLRKDWPRAYAFAFEEALAGQVPGQTDHDQIRVYGAKSAAEGRLDGTTLDNADAASRKRMLKAAALLEQATAYLVSGEYLSCKKACDELVAEFANDAGDAVHALVAGALISKAVAIGQMGDGLAAIAAYDEFLSRVNNSHETRWRQLVAYALFNKAVMLHQMGQSAAEIGVYDDLLSRFADANEAGLREFVAEALFNKAFTLAQMADSSAALAGYDDVVARFDGADEAVVRVQIAKALINKANLVGLMRGKAAAVGDYDAVVARFANADEAALREQVAKALFNKAIAHGEMGDAAAAIACYNDVVARFGNADEAALREQVAQTLINKAILVGRMGDNAGAIASYGDVVARFANAHEPVLREQVATALISKAATLGQSGDSAAAITACDDLLAHFVDAGDPVVGSQIAIAFLIKIVELNTIGDRTAAIAACDDFLTRFAHADQPRLRKRVAMVLIYKAAMLRQAGNVAAAISALERALHISERESDALPATNVAQTLRLANMLLDLHEDLPRAEKLFLQAASFEPLLANANLAWLYLMADKVSVALCLRKSLGDLPSYGLALLDAAVDLVKGNFGSATDHLAVAFGGQLDAGIMDLSDDFERLLRIAERRGYGERLLGWFEESAIADRLAPIYVAFKAYIRGEKILLDVNPEVRGPAKIIYDRLDAPRRHRRGPGPKKERAKRGRRATRQT